METKRKKAAAKPKPKPNGDYPLAPKDAAWLDRMVRNYTQLIGKSIDAETNFIVKKKEWAAALKLGRQSARDRFLAGMTLLEMQEKMKEEFGYPFWPWLTTMGVPTKTAQRAIELAKFYRVECNLGDNTITECYAEIKAAKAKAKVKKDDDTTEEEDEQQDEQEANEDEQDNGIAGKIGKDMDSVSNPPPNLSPGDEPPEGDGPSESLNDEDKELYGQEELTWDLEGIEELLQEALKSLSADLGPFPEPEKAVNHIEKCIDLCEQLKVKIPVSQ